MSSSRAARKIHPRAPWVKHPGVYAAPDPWLLWEAPRGRTAHPATPGARGTKSSAQARADAATGVSLVDPPKVPATSTLVPVFIDGKRVRVPVDWDIAIDSSHERSQLYLREPGGTLHVLLLDQQGLLREMAGLPADLVSDLVAKYFPGRR
ncbi:MULTISPECIES: hypothetical protein [unclassified Microbacterium]|uniref:hypothetical protein n=1 Tax=unclassified Microbacterium TaxID=2609290 RepID=UPI0011BDCD15|nr:MULTISPECIES: hypothetical protein [unclassified Microbacterium]NYF30063.1 hypothetical protein [Microbacterium sp. JAI119]